MSIGRPLDSGSESPDDNQSKDVQVAGHTELKQMPKTMIGVRLPGLIYPASMYRDYDSPTVAAPDREQDVLRSAIVRMTPPTVVSCGLLMIVGQHNGTRSYPERIWGHEVYCS